MLVNLEIVFSQQNDATDDFNFTCACVDSELLSVKGPANANQILMIWSFVLLALGLGFGRFGQFARFGFRRFDRPSIIGSAFGNPVLVTAVVLLGVPAPVNGWHDFWHCWCGIWWWYDIGSMILKFVYIYIYMCEYPLTILTSWHIICAYDVGFQGCKHETVEIGAVAVQRSRLSSNLKSEGQVTSSSYHTPNPPVLILFSTAQRFATPQRWIPRIQPGL